MRIAGILIIACFALKAGAEYQQQSSQLTIGPGGVSVGAGNKNLGVQVKDGSATLNFSASGLISGRAQDGSTILVLPPGALPPAQPSSSFTDSETFFKGIGKPPEPEPEYRHRPRNRTVQ